MAFSKIGKFFGVANDDDEMLDDEYAEEQQLNNEDNYSAGAVDRDNVNLLNNKAVIINFSRMEDASARRVVDFITGTVYALNGEIQRIGDKIFLATPPKFVTNGKISDLVDKKDTLS